MAQSRSGSRALLLLFLGLGASLSAVSGELPVPKAGEDVAHSGSQGRGASGGDAAQWPTGRKVSAFQTQGTQVSPAPVDLWHVLREQVVGLCRKVQESALLRHFEAAPRYLLPGTSVTSSHLESDVSSSHVSWSEDDEQTWQSYSEGLGEEAFESASSHALQPPHKSAAFLGHASAAALARSLQHHARCLHGAWRSLWHRLTGGAAPGHTEGFQDFSYSEPEGLELSSEGGSERPWERQLHPLFHNPRDIWQSYSEEMTV